MQAARIMTMPPLRGEMRYDEPMARHLSWRAGGNAKCYYLSLIHISEPTRLQV